jgi:hypothetical protein
MNNDQRFPWRAFRAPLGLVAFAVPVGWLVYATLAPGRVK